MILLRSVTRDAIKIYVNTHVVPPKLPDLTIEQSYFPNKVA